MDQPEEQTPTPPPAQFEPGHLMSHETWGRIKAELGEQQK